MSIQNQARELFIMGGLTSQDRLVVSVSGGPDSLALLHLLAQQELHPAANLIVAHLNHQLRQSATDDAHFVAEIATAWGLTVHIERVDVAELARQDGLSLEEAGRQARYSFLARLANEVDATFVATGHNADDQAETVLMHFLRGTGLAGLRGMRPAGPLPGAPELTLLRPLLTTNRTEIETYCEHHKLAPLVDASNTDQTFFRNRLRHELLPFLATYNPGIGERLCQLAETTAAEYELLENQRRAAWTELLLKQGQDWLLLDLARWRNLPLALQRSTLRDAVWQLRPGLRDVGFRTTELARQVAGEGQTGDQASLPGGITLRLDYNRLWLHAPGGEPATSLPQLPAAEPMSLSVPGQVDLANGWRLTASPAGNVTLDAILANRDPWLAYINWQSGKPLVVRPRQPGERFQPLGMAGRSTSLKEYMIDHKIPAVLRPRWPIVAMEVHLVWLAGYNVDERVRVGPESREIIELSLERVAD